MPPKSPSKGKTGAAKDKGTSGEGKVPVTHGKVAVQVSSARKMQSRVPQGGYKGVGLGKPRTWATEKGFVACEVGNIIYAVPIVDVQEILVPSSLTPIPQSPPGIVGALDHRGEVVPIFDLGQRLGFGDTTSPRRKWILVRTRNRTLGVVVHQVHEVFRVMETDVRPAPALSVPEEQVTKHVVTYDGGLAYILGAEKLAQLADLPRLEEDPR